MTQSTWEFRELQLPRGTSREVARQWLTATVETGRWELDRSRLTSDGRRTVRLRRKVYRFVASS